MKLERAYLQAPTKIGALGGVTTLNVSMEGAKNCEALEASSNGLIVSMHGAQTLIPWANVKAAEIATNSKTESKSTK